MAPETYMDGDYGYGTSVDVYSYGMLLYKMFSDKIDFGDGMKIRSHQKFWMKIGKGLRLIKPERIPEHYWELIQKCWQQEPPDRPTFDDIVEILKDDKYALEEFGMKTNIQELHDYQRRIDNDEVQVASSQSSTDQATKELKDLKEKVAPYESFFSLQNDHDDSENCFIGQDDEEHHQIISKIGEGATSIAYKVIDKRTGRIMCKKILKIEENQDSAFKAVQNALKEFQVLYGLHHPCICGAIGINTSEVVLDANIGTDDDKEVTTIALFLEFQDYSLSDALKKMNNTLKTRIVVEIAHAMKYIHKHGLIHRDLKIDNIRLNCVYEAQIIDFGLVRIHECLTEGYSFVESSMTKGVGTLAYMSPEMLSEEDYDYKTDIYSFGVVLYYIFVGSSPRQNLKEKMAGKKISLPQPSSSISKVCIDIISKCLSTQPSERPTFEDILKIIRENSYALADFVDQNIVSHRDQELQFFEKQSK